MSKKQTVIRARVNIEEKDSFYNNVEDMSKAIQTFVLSVNKNEKRLINKFYKQKKKGS